MKHPKLIHKKLGKERVWGFYDKAKNTIELDERLKGKKKLEILVHEYFHHLFPFMDEETVTKSAKDLTDFLWKHHLRIVEP
jgi:hypothetical protein